MKNFSIIKDGKEYWISRSMATVTFIFNVDDNFDKFVLAVKRGKGAADNIGKWCCPCGYLDFDETLQECAVREVHEETGFLIKPNNLKLFYINSNPEDSKRQNVTARFKAFVDDMQTQNLTTEFSEKDEVEEIRWINLKELDDFEWAFNHKKIINNLRGLGGITII